jgi:hypothetical protein
MTAFIKNGHHPLFPWFRGFLPENPCGSSEYVSDGQVLRTKFLTLSTSHAFFGLIFWSYVFPVLGFDLIAHFLHVELVIQGYYFSYVDALRAW